MNVANGLFRLWIVISVGWLAVVGFVTWQQASPITPGPWNNFVPSSETLPPGFKSDAPADASPPAASPLSNMSDNDLKALYAKQSAANAPGNGATGDDDLPPGFSLTPPPAPPGWQYKLVPVQGDPFADERAAIFRLAALAALVPPLIVLLFGWGFVWAFRGFRTRH